MSFTDHQLLAAVRVARVIDSEGNTTDDARQSYRLVPSQGEHRASDLAIGETVLVNTSLLEHTDEDRLRPSGRLRVLASLGDDDAIALLRRLVARKSRDELAADTGLLGELEVVRRSRENLRALGRPDISESVQQVSILDDSLGYDVLAPMIGPGARHIEVKTTRQNASETFEFFLSRNEFDTGRRDPEWALVACRRIEDRDIAILGWCRAQSLYPYVPEDRSSRWTEAQLQIPVSVLFDGIPPAI